jgi:Tfp pilus assembly pilus retraction ATPase PilT
MDTIGEYDMTDLLTLIVSERAEGLSIAPGRAPAVHLRGEMHTIEGPAVSPEHASSLLRCLADTRQMRELHERGTAEFLFTFRELARFRVQARSEHEQVQFQVYTITV